MHGTSAGTGVQMQQHKVEAVAAEGLDQSVLGFISVTWPRPLLKLWESK